MSDNTEPTHDPIFDPDSAAGRTFEQALQQACSSIAAASDLRALQRVAGEMQALVHRLVEQAQDAESMMTLISALNDVLTRRVIEVIGGDAAPDGARWCWIALGSEGRREQTLSSDQDNGIIFEGDQPPDVLRAFFLPLAHRINAALDACGFPLCTGQVMASNPQWCLSLHEWKERFSSWIDEGDPQALLNASIFFDLRPLHGARELADELTGWLAQEASSNSRFLFQMAANALQREVPLGLFRRITVEKEGKHPGAINLKVNAATLFIDAARIYGLASGKHASNTIERFRLAIEAQRLHPADVAKWIEAFYFIQSLRLKQQQLSYNRGEDMHNHVIPGKLDAGDRAKLIDALRQARSLQNRMRLDYPGSHGL